MKDFVQSLLFNQINGESIVSKKPFYIDTRLFLYQRCSHLLQLKVGSPKIVILWPGEICEPGREKTNGTRQF